LTLWLLAACTGEPPAESRTNPFFAGFNEPIDYAAVVASDLTGYADAVLASATATAEAIRTEELPGFDNVVLAFDKIYRDVAVAANNSWMLYWVSPDAATRDAGLEAYKKLDAWRVALYSDKAIFDKIVAVSEAEELSGAAATLVADLIRDMRHTGVDLAPDALARFIALNEEINDLTTQYSSNMNSDASMLRVDAAGARGLPENFKAKYAIADGQYEIPVISANRGPVLNNADDENTRRSFATLYANRATDKNLDILDTLVARRDELGKLMGHATYADYHLEVNMAKTPGTVWQFLDDLTERTAAKAAEDLLRLKQYRSDHGGVPADQDMQAWDINYYRNAILKAEYGVDNEKIREYLPLAGALSGMMDFYQDLLGLEFRAVDSPSVWHEEIELYEVYENGELAGRFYLDLFPRPNKESWFYGVGLTPGGERAEGYEVPVAMLLGNFTRPTAELPSLISHGELNTLFHEFGHIMADMAYKGRYALQSDSRADFGEAMSQIFENWIWDYDVLKSFARHYATGEVLPEETLEKMLAAKNLTSGLSAQRSLEFAVYDLTLYNKYDANDPMPTDDIWGAIAGRFAYSNHIPGTHPQASWIHINTHPVYVYGYLWSEVYAQDMFTQFEAHGLRDRETGMRYRQLILANGTQRPIDEVVEEFLGRSSNNEAYVRSLGLD
jgi:Zn-dependent oligopeptidase